MTWYIHAQVHVRNKGTQIQAGRKNNATTNATYKLKDRVQNKIKGILFIDG